ncbi:unnamed protein product, partial [Timema podura]|nr:unnamed protein product [Timema podura]
MLLTLYYMAATWIQSWRLNSMRLKILQLLSQNGSLVVYREPVPLEVEGLGLYLSKVTSSSCINKCEAKVSDLLWYVGNKRGCSVFPQQRVNVVQWISFDTDKCAFPIELNGSQVVLSEENRLHLLLEADYQSATSVRDENYCQVKLDD